MASVFAFFAVRVTKGSWPGPATGSVAQRKRFAVRSGGLGLVPTIITEIFRTTLKMVPGK